jgi:hypothetical protein
VISGIEMSGMGALFSVRSIDDVERGFVGRVSAELVTSYPPAIPVLAPGELITADAVTAPREAAADVGQIAYALTHAATSRWSAMGAGPGRPSCGSGRPGLIPAPRVIRQNGRPDGFRPCHRRALPSH